LTTDGSGLGVGVPGSGCSGFAAATHGWTTTRTRGFGLLHEWHSPSDSSSSLPPPSLILVRRRMDWGKSLKGGSGSGGDRRSASYRAATRVRELKSGRRGCGVGARGGHPRLPTLQGGGGHGAGAVLASPPLPPRRASSIRAGDGRKTGKGG
jgi:hypothetical protein